MVQVVEFLPLVEDKKLLYDPAYSMFDDDLVTQRARASAAMVLT